MSNWPDFKKGDMVVAIKETHKGRTGICLNDNTETQFGHKHVEVYFDNDVDDIPRREIIRTKFLKML